MKKIIPSQPASQSNSLTPRVPTYDPRPAKPFGKRVSAAPAEPDMHQLADREHPHAPRRIRA